MYGSSWAMMRALCYAFGAKSAARPNRRTCPATSSSNLVLLLRTSIGDGTRPKRARSSLTSRPISDIRGFDGWGQPLMAVSKVPARCSKSKFMLPWSFSEEAAAEKYMPQLQHNMWVVAARTAVLSVITGGGKWVEIKTHADPIYQHLIVTAERKFWRCVESGEPPTLFGVEPPKPWIEAIRIVDMNASNAWAEFAAIFARTRSAHLEHERAKAELKSLMPEDAQQAIGHGVRAKRSKSGAISFDLAGTEDSRYAPV